MAAKSSLLLAMLAVCLCGGGCSAVTSRDVSELLTGEKSDDAAPGKSGLKVQVDGANIALSSGQVALTKSAQFLPRIQSLLAEQRRASARECVERQPDVALEVLRQGLADPRSSSTLEFVAQTYDHYVGVPARQGWSICYSASNERIVAYGKARLALLESLGRNAITPRLVTELVAAATATDVGVVKIDAYRTVGLAQMVALKPDRAVTAFRTAGELAEPVDPYQELSILLLLSDALRRQNEGAEANRVWQVAVERAARLAARRPPLIDPVFWDNASYQHPLNVAWPLPVVLALAQVSPLVVPLDEITEQLRDTDRSAIVWGAIGQSLLDRGDHDAALVAFKRAETNADSDALRGWSRVAQANAIARLGQGSAATAIVAGLVNHADPAVAAAATATLGTVKMAAADTDAGYRLLRKGLESNQLGAWYGVADAEADLGLASLLRGADTEGLNLLHSAQSRFESRQEVSRLTRCLTNEAEYYRYRKQKDDEARVTTRIKTLER